MSTTSIRSLTAALVVTLSAASTLLTGVGPAAAHAGHTEQLTASTTTPSTTTPANPTTSSTTPSTPTTTGPATGQLAGRGPTTTVGDKVIRSTPTTGRGDSKAIGLASPTGGAAGIDVECLVDFDDDLVLQYSIPNAAEDTFMNAPWFQKCYDHYYPAVAVKPMEHNHFHLGYEDPRVGPCSGDQTDWGRKQDPQPDVTDPDFGAWIVADCVADIDPVTEPRTGIRNHLPGQRAQVFAYDGDGHLPFQLRTLQVVGDDVEVCHLPPGPWEAAGPGGSPWQCLTLGQGYWDLSNHVDNAIEVRIEYLGHGMLDNIGIDLLEG